jgi:hypothetical protein
MVDKRSAGEAGERRQAVAEAMQKKSLDSPDETRTFDQGQAQVVSLGDFMVTRTTLQLESLLW